MPSQKNPKSQSGFYVAFCMGPIKLSGQNHKEKHNKTNKNLQKTKFSFRESNNEESTHILSQTQRHDKTMG